MNVVYESTKHSRPAQGAPQPKPKSGLYLEGVE